MSSPSTLAFFKEEKAFFRIIASGAVIMTFSIACQCPYNFSAVDLKN
jgi:hypothetical protein